MEINRRSFIQNMGMLGGIAALVSPPVLGAEKGSGFARPSKIRLGMVTYNIGKDWDVETIIKNCEASKFEGVELRTTHAHGVEVSLNKEQRATVKKRFQDSKVTLMGLGSAFDYHTPDQAKLKRDIEATKEYMVLAHDVGATGVKVRPNGLPKEVPKEKTLEQIGKSLAELGNFGKELGLQIRLEVHGAETALLPNIRKILDVSNHPNVGACWNSNQSDLDGQGWDYNFNLVKHQIFSVHMRDLSLDEYPFRKLLAGLNDVGYKGFCLAEIPESKDPVRVMQYYRSLFLAYQGLL